jgi:ribosomal protein S18 acetylase RimI-like enzyme
MIARSHAELYDRGAATLLASWGQYARAAAGAALERLPGVTVAVFPEEPQRGFFNNALLERGLGAVARATALEAMEAAYAAAGVSRFAAWVHESDEAMRDGLERRGYVLDASTRAMGMSLDAIPVPRPDIELGPPDWRECVRILDVSPDLFGPPDEIAFEVLIAVVDGESVATAMAYDHHGDCGIYNVTTLEHARRRGLGSALTALHLHDAAARGCRTASLQSTPIAERVYASVGFRDLGRFLEYVRPEPA